MARQIKAAHRDSRIVIAQPPLGLLFLTIFWQGEILSAVI